MFFSRFNGSYRFQIGTTEVPFSFYYTKGTYPQCDTSLLILALVTWLSECHFSNVKLLPLPLQYVLWKKLLMCRPHLRMRDLLSISLSLYINSLKIFLNGRFVSSPPFTFYSIIIYISMDSWMFIFVVII